MNSKRKILVADDSATIQKVIRLALSNEGYEVLSAGAGQEALQQIHLHRPDVVLVDIALPEKDAETIRTTIKADPDLRHTRFVLLTSAYEKHELSVSSLNSYEGILSKPFDPSVLRSEIAKALNASIASYNQMPPLPLQESSTLSELPPLPNFGADLPPIELVESQSHESLEGFREQTLQAAASGIDLFQPLTPPPLPKIPEAPSETLSPDADIKKLTESTIRLSGLDEFEWSVHEPAAVPPPLKIDTAQLKPKTPEPLTPFPPVEKPSTASIESLPYTMAQIEKVIEQEVEKRIQSMAQKMVPEIAERMVKQEIERLLSED